MILRPRSPAPADDTLRRVALRFLEAVDDIEETDVEACEKAVNRILRRATLGTPFHVTDIWRQATEIERDPLERLRPVVGSDWEPNLA